MARVNHIEAASSGRPKKLFAAALAVCCLWQGASPSAFGQAVGQHQQHQHEHGPAKEGAPERQPAAKPTIPDVTLLDQDGREVRFYTDLVKGKVVVINFIFTSCKVVCPPLGANFAKVQNMSGGRVGKDVYLISVSTDPETDTPARLRAWGEKFGAGPGWRLVTGEKAQVDKLLLALTGDVARKGEHTAVVLVGSDPRGEWRQAYGLAPPGRLLGLVDELSR
ncbi:MAG: SCO family protein [Pyrinomonadaceae bacterium]